MELGKVRSSNNPQPQERQFITPNTIYIQHDNPSSTEPDLSESDIVHSDDKCLELMSLVYTLQMISQFLQL
ncbi:hypothetical protein STEG23_034999 [Scotinomys teguina]